METHRQRGSSEILQTTSWEWLGSLGSSGYEYHMFLRARTPHQTAQLKEDCATLSLIMRARTTTRTRIQMISWRQHRCIVTRDSQHDWDVFIRFYSCIRLGCGVTTLSASDNSIRGTEVFVEVVNWVISQKEELNYENDQTNVHTRAKAFPPSSLKTSKFTAEFIWQRQTLRDVASEEIPGWIWKKMSDSWQVQLLPETGPCTYTRRQIGHHTAPVLYQETKQVTLTGLQLIPFIQHWRQTGSSYPPVTRGAHWAACKPDW